MKEFIAGLLLLLGIGYVARQWFQKTIVTAVTADNAKCLELVGSTTGEREGNTYIVGSVRNNCDRKFSLVTVLFNLDRDPRKGDFPAGVAYAYVRDLNGRETRDFQTKLPVSSTVNYRFDKVTGY